MLFLREYNILVGFSGLRDMLVFENFSLFSRRLRLRRVTAVDLLFHYLYRLYAIVYIRKHRCVLHVNSNTSNDNKQIGQRPKQNILWSRRHSTENNGRCLINDNIVQLFRILKSTITEESLFQNEICVVIKL